MGADDNSETSAGFEKHKLFKRNIWMALQLHSSLIHDDQLTEELPVTS